jgi:hypothetical protein
MGLEKQNEDWNTLEVISELPMKTHPTGLRAQVINLL